MSRTQLALALLCPWGSACRAAGEPERSVQPGPSPGSVSESQSTPGSPPAETSEAPETSLPPPFEPDYAQPGPLSVQISSGQRSSGPGCLLSWTLFQPEAPADVLVVLTHGFSRDQDVLADLAEHLASHGLPVVTASLCHSTPFDNDPDQDAQDLVALADELGPSQRLYAGHSAGGLRSVLAAAADPGAVAVLGLDLVDTQDLALDAAPTLAVPLYGLLGEPSSCNSDSNGLPVYDATPGAVPLLVVDADHCDFESPTDWMCTTFCDAPGQQFSDPQIQTTVRGLATALLLWRSGLSEDASSWWTEGGASYEALLDMGAIFGR
jgi:pimeloyl-ACP methyl ester carboxylesterase